MSSFATPPPFDVDAAETLFAPSVGEEGHWVGAPCVVDYDGATYLGVRERTPDARGHRVSIYRRTGRTSYEQVAAVSADALGVVSVERPALVPDPRGPDLHLYLPVDHGSNEWTIQKLDGVDDPAEFDPETARDVLRPRAGESDCATVKDPLVVTVGGRYHMYYSGHDSRSEQAHLATSVDGVTWTRHRDNPIVERAYWHDHHTRISCVVPAPDAPVWLVFYDGSGLTDHGRTWNLRTGVAVSTDLATFVDTSPDGPLYSAPTATGTGIDSFGTCRYLDVRREADDWELFAEVARPDGAFEVRYQRVPIDRN